MWRICGFKNMLNINTLLILRVIQTLKLTTGFTAQVRRPPSSSTRGKRILKRSVNTDGESLLTMTGTVM